MKIGIIGYGKMGRAIARLVEDKHTISLKINRSNLSELTVEHLRNCDVAIEFSEPSAAFHNIQLCLNAGIPVVSGTTGWLAHKTSLEEMVQTKNGSFFYASNYSLGVNLFFAINKYAADLMAKFPDYQVSMKELHHVHKLDAPSGTGLSLAKDILQARPQLKGWSLAATDKDHLHIDAIREGEITGTHAVEYISNEDKIYLEHEAFTRDSFARGAILAAEWIIGKKGIFGMKDLLDL